MTLSEVVKSNSQISALIFTYYYYYYYYYYSSLYLCLLKVLYKCVVNACDICKLQ